MQEPPPYKPEAEAKRQAYLARRGVDDPMARCLLSGVPRITVRPLPFEIIQLRDRVVILYEVHHGFRIIPTDGRGHPDDHEPSYLGDSVGRWEGDTLVVDVIGFNTDTWLAGVGTIHSEKLRVTERYTRDTYDTVVYDVTMEDPEVFTKPWKQQAIFHLRPGERIREYECIENNEDIVRWEKLLQSDPGVQDARAEVARQSPSAGAGRRRAASAASATGARRLVGRLLLARVIHLLRCQQGGRGQACPARRDDGQAERRDRNVVGHVRDDECVVLPELEIEGLELPADAFDGLARHVAALDAAVLAEALRALRGVGHGNEIFRHGSPVRLKCWDVRRGAERPAERRLA